MKDKTIWGLSFILIVFLGLGFAASNKNLEETLIIHLEQNPVDNFIALPYNNSLPVQDAAYLRNDIIAKGGLNPYVYNWTGSVWQYYKGGGVGQVKFVIVPGAGYKVKIDNAIDWSVTGSHNPSVSISISANVPKLIALPYNSPSTTASKLRNEIIAAGGTGVTIYNWDSACNCYKKWSGGGIGQIDFPITAGKSYFVKSNSDIANWFPANN